MARRGPPARCGWATWPRRSSRAAATPISPASPPNGSASKSRWRTKRASALPGAGGERHRRLLGQDQEGEALLDIEPHARGIVLEVADREILADRELEITAARGDHQTSLDARRP